MPHAAPHPARSQAKPRLPFFVRAACAFLLGVSALGCASEPVEVCVDRGLEAYAPEVLEGAMLWTPAGAEIHLGCPGTVLVRFGTVPQDDSGHRTVGWTHVPRSGRITVVLDIEKEWTPESVRRVVAHEIGHVLGIAEHVSDPAAIMHAGPTADDLHRADREALCQAIGGEACSAS